MNTSLFTAVLGAAGSGKSYRLNRLLEQDSRYALKASSSGISAVNINATTLHSTLGYFNTEELLYKVADGSLIRTLRKIRKNFDRIACDEIGMLPGQQLDLLVYAIDQHNLKYPDTPLGIEASGDPGQLPPVATNGEKFVPFFNAKCWDRFDVSYLTEIKRQDNPEFIRALMLIRAGQPLEAADWFEQAVGFESKIDENFDGSTIMSTNREVDAFNVRNLRKVTSVEKSYKKILNGQNKGEWNNISDEIVLKPGCSVILLVNNLPEYANGDLGTVKEVFLDSVLVELARTGKQHLIQYRTLENTKPGTTEIIGKLEFMPLRLAYATTIHKTQGLTLDAIQCKVNDNFIRRLHGGLYTALSRCRSPQGLRIVGSKDDFIRACYVDPIYKPYVQVPDNLFANTLAA